MNILLYGRSIYRAYEKYIPDHMIYYVPQNTGCRTKAQSQVPTAFARLYGHKVGKTETGQLLLLFSFSPSEENNSDNIFNKIR